MIYLYECPICEIVVEIIKDSADHKKGEYCKDCGSSLNRIFTAPTVAIKKTMWANYNPGMGEVVKSRSHYNDLIKKKGLIEVGNEDMKKIDAKYRKEKKEKWKREWDNLRVEGL